MIGISGQWPGATLFTNGVLLLDPATLLEAQGYDLDKLTEAEITMAVGHTLAAYQINPEVWILLTDPANN
jgi:hypothetical protein